MPGESASESPVQRREFLRGTLRWMTLLGAAGLGGAGIWRGSQAATLWQIDPARCLKCDQCATACVLEHSAVACVHAYAMCGYCQLCTGYFEPEPNDLNTGAENQLCPTAAIRRTYVEDPYYEYTIIKDLCIGCAKCVAGCTTFGNGSLYLQVQHDRCVNCNDCAIARVCPGDAFQRVPLDEPYFSRHVEPGV